MDIIAEFLPLINTKRCIFISRYDYDGITLNLLQPNEGVVITVQPVCGYTKTVLTGRNTKFKSIKMSRSTVMTHAPLDVEQQLFETSSLSNLPS